MSWHLCWRMVQSRHTKNSDFGSEINKTFPDVSSTFLCKLKNILVFIIKRTKKWWQRRKKRRKYIFLSFPIDRKLCLHPCERYEEGVGINEMGKLSSIIIINEVKLCWHIFSLTQFEDNAIIIISRNMICHQQQSKNQKTWKLLSICHSKIVACSFVSHYEFFIFRCFLMLFHNFSRENVKMLNFFSSHFLFLSHVSFKHRGISKIEK